ncbi:MAG: serine/threonine protein kinase [Pseudomonadota bacterium]
MTESRKTLKQDTFGRIVLRDDHGVQSIERDISVAPRWAQWLARRLAYREARAIAALGRRSGYPMLLAVSDNQLVRSFVHGDPMHEGRPTTHAYFVSALRQLRIMHRCGIAHNDLAKEPNWLVTPEGLAAIVDFQLATVHKKRGRIFRWLAREDLRHYLKHKRTYRPTHLTAREKKILATPALSARIWRSTGKRVYLFVTRKLLNWSDREGAGDRGRSDSRDKTHDD